MKSACRMFCIHKKQKKRRKKQKKETSKQANKQKYYI